VSGSSLGSVDEGARVLSRGVGLPASAITMPVGTSEESQDDMDEHPDTLLPRNYRAFASAIPAVSSKMAPYQPLVATAPLNGHQRSLPGAQGGEIANIRSHDRGGARDLLAKGAPEKLLPNTELE
jgi:hypothetical protein